MMMTKKCKSCGEQKAAEQFLSDARTSDGLGTKCKDCRGEVAEESAHQQELPAPPSVEAASAPADLKSDQPAKETMTAASTRSPSTLPQSIADAINSFDKLNAKATPEFKLGVLRCMLSVEIKCLPDARQLFEAYEKVDEALMMSLQAERKMQDALADIESKLTN